jgi:uncharacterized protein YcbK (DUF882 family)
MDYFPEKPWACKCGCGFAQVSSVLIRKLNVARGYARVPFEILSACRCSSHNEFVGGTVNSAHLTGQAVDIKATDSRVRYAIIRGLFDAGFTRVGIAKNFVHADVSLTLPQNVIWFY